MRIETIFGAVAVLTLIALAAFALSSGAGTGVQAATPSAQPVLASSGGDTCGCYRQAYEAARANPDFTGPTYEGGYGACREAAGREGGNAWSAGWQDAMDGRSVLRACRGER